MADRAQPIRFTYKDKDYTLEFNRRSLIDMSESCKFDIIEVATDGKFNPLMLPDMFKYSFKMHHTDTSSRTINEIYKLMTDKGSLMQALFELAAQPLVDVLTDPEDEGKAIAWKRTE